MLKDYLKIARPDHWFKNIFVLPGVIVASWFSHISIWDRSYFLVLGVIAACLLASANYVINEWLDAKFDRFHPLKKSRPVVTKNLKGHVVLLEYLLFAGSAFLVGWQINEKVVYMLAVFLMMGLIYNVAPLRSKDIPYVDVLTEAINNPIRLLIGWFCVVDVGLPPMSLIVAYWMGGAFLMALKRYAEYRFIANPEMAGKYRKSFIHYNEEKLLVFSLFNVICTVFFLSAFLFRYRMELLISFPFISLMFTWYFKIAMQAKSTVQTPEKLYKEGYFLAYTVFSCGVMYLLLKVDLPQIASAFSGKPFSG